MKARLGVIDKEFNEVIEGKMQTMPTWLTWYLAEVSIQDLVEHDMIPEIDESGILNLSAQHISDLAGIERLPSLDMIKILKLGGNTLRSIGARAFSALPNLEELWLRGNLIAHIDPKAFAGHVHLRRIDLLANTIEEIVPGTFADLPNLNFIDLQVTAVTDEELAQIRAETTAEVIA
jgi:Leucine-rich repeat (LRR) protein